MWVVTMLRGGGFDDKVIIFDEWLAANEKWKNSKYAISLKKYSGTERVGCRRWLTRKQLLQKYDNEVDVVDAIILAKMEDGVCDTHVKPHPDAPGCKVPWH